MTPVVPLPVPLGTNTAEVLDMTVAEQRYADACRKDIENPTPANLAAVLDAARAVYRERHP